MGNTISNKLRLQNQNDFTTKSYFELVLLSFKFSPNAISKYQLFYYYIWNTKNVYTDFVNKD